MRLFRIILATCAAAALLAAPADAGQPHPPDAVGAALKAFDTHTIVAKSSPDPGTFVFDLVRDPRFPDRLTDIAVECGNSRLQPLLDAYILGGDVPEISHVWRDTTQPSCGFSTFYEQLFALVRQVNASLPPDRKIRVLACDPPIDWSQVRTPADAEPFHDRDASIVSVVKTQVLQKNRKVLMLFGLGHLTHNGGSGAVSQLEREYPGAAYVVADHYGFTTDNARLERRLGAWPALVPMQGSWLGTLDASYFPTSREYPPGTRGYPGVDAYLYEGPADLLLREPLSARAVLDTDYMNELRRRAAAVDAPPDSLEWPEFFFERERRSGVLLRG
ncbi:hypothetical protein M8542_34435 [Amycolatopsis sp. OK19-0408]|uniref:Uncharacterized protein n=1 Tax=Amycolatopsis iheyensis TaxID=2945988 RepID=A0A9X2NN16_9PSEU|nr:hypothetical protein [Amycolatopsis iheyensis]MCR6487935.1 hypothetical protein [Amycolatopsis iheyensis]